jgi:SMODS and SLOG-associating 2TM effector domain 1/Protein of unknown function (DUF4231)
MIEEAWNEYRGWAKRARILQTSSRQWSRGAFACAGVAAILGAAASQVTNGSILGRTLAFLAAAAVAATPILGREILSVDSEARWLRARATAEAIKSECFRFAAQLGDYAGPSARSAFIAKRGTLTEHAERAGLTPLPDPAPSSGDDRRPPLPLTAPWYVEHRLDEQMRYYANGQARNEAGVRRYRAAGFAAAVIAAILGVAASNFGQGWFAPWVGVMTTLAAAATAYGLLDRAQYLAGAYGPMVTRLSRIKELFSDGTPDLSALVTATEDLLQTEHGAWIERMMKAPRDMASEPTH